MNQCISVGLIGAGPIGAHHAKLILQRVPGARWAAIAGRRPGAADDLERHHGARPVVGATALLEDPEIDAVITSGSTDAHADLVVAASARGKAIFCEKSMALTLRDADRATAVAQQAGVILQVGFNPRFDSGSKSAHHAVVSGAVGTVQRMRSPTRDPGLANPASVPPWAVFQLTLIHDFDALLWLNPGAEPIEVYATADALVAPHFNHAGLLDTAVVVITFSNGARAVAEASFSAAYGYDVGAEVVGSAGMVSAGCGARSSAQLFTASGASVETARSDTELMNDAYRDQLVEFVTAIREGRAPSVTGPNARLELEVAQAYIESVRDHMPACLARR